MARRSRLPRNELIKLGMALAKAKGANIGTPENFTDAGRRKGQKKSREVRRQKANEFVAGIAHEVLAALRKEGTLAAAARHLNDLGLRTSRDATWRADAVLRIVRRIEAMGLVDRIALITFRNLRTQAATVQALNTMRIRPAGGGTWTVEALKASLVRARAEERAGTS